MQARVDRARHARQVMAAGIARLLTDRTIYAKARPGYHPIAQVTIDGIVGAKAEAQG